MGWNGEHRGFVVVPWAFDHFNGRRGVAGTVTRFKPMWRFPLGIPKGKGFKTSSSISWGFEGNDPTGKLHSAWANPESDEELPGTSSAMCCHRRPPCVWSDFLNPFKICFKYIFKKYIQFFSRWLLSYFYTSSKSRRSLCPILYYILITAFRLVTLCRQCILKMALALQH